MPIDGLELSKPEVTMSCLQEIDARCLSNVLEVNSGKWVSGNQEGSSEGVLGTLSHSCFHSGTYFSFDSTPPHSYSN